MPKMYKNRTPKEMLAQAQSPKSLTMIRQTEINQEKQKQKRKPKKLNYAERYDKYH